MAAGEPNDNSLGQEEVCRRMYQRGKIEEIDETTTYFCRPGVVIELLRHQAVGGDDLVGDRQHRIGLHSLGLG